MDTHGQNYQEPMLHLYKSSLEYISKCLEAIELPTDILAKFPDLVSDQSQIYSTNAIYTDFKKTREVLGKQWAAHTKKTLENEAKVQDCSRILKFIWNFRKITKKLKFEDVELLPDMQSSKYPDHCRILIAMEHFLRSQPDLNQSVSLANNFNVKTTENKDSESATRTPDDTVIKHTKTTVVSITDAEKQITGTDNDSDDDDIETSNSQHKDGHVSTEEAMDISEDKVSVLPSNGSLLDINAANDMITDLKKTIKDLTDENTKVKQDLLDINAANDMIKDLKKDLVDENTKVKQELETQKAIASQLNDDLKQLVEDKQAMQEEFDSIVKLPDGKLKEQLSILKKTEKRMKVENDNLRKLCTKLDKENKKLNAEKETLQRLSIVAGRKMKDNNPSIADLGDPNRPEKLSERFREIYDNEWTEVLDYITENTEKPEGQAVKDIASALQVIFYECSRQVYKNKKRIIKIIGYPEDALEKQYSGGNEGHDPTMKIVKDLVKGSADRICDSLLQKVKGLDIVQEILKNGDKSAENFVTQCSRVCLFMCAQDPPMALDFVWKTGDPFDKDKFTPFTSTGDVIDYVVWPVMYLSENGSIMNKGVAQGKKK